MIFKTDENIKSHNGIFDSPMEVNMVERMLYINKNGKPAKYMRKYSTASSIISAGVCNILKSDFCMDNNLGDRIGNKVQIAIRIK